MSYNDFINLFETAKSVKKRKGRTGIDLTLGNETDEETSLPPSEPKVLRIRNSQQGATDSDLLVFPVEFFNVEGKAQFMYKNGDQCYWADCTVLGANSEDATYAVYDPDLPPNNRSIVEFDRVRVKPQDPHS